MENKKIKYKMYDYNTLYQMEYSELLKLDDQMNLHHRNHYTNEERKILDIVFYERRNERPQLTYHNQIDTQTIDNTMTATTNIFFKPWLCILKVILFPLAIFGIINLDAMISGLSVNQERNGLPKQIFKI